MKKDKSGCACNPGNTRGLQTSGWQPVVDYRPPKMCPFTLSTNRKLFLPITVGAGCVPFPQNWQSPVGMGQWTAGCGTQADPCPGKQKTEDALRPRWCYLSAACWPALSTASLTEWLAIPVNLCLAETIEAWLSKRVYSCIKSKKSVVRVLKEIRHYLLDSIGWISVSSMMKPNLESQKI